MLLLKSAHVAAVVIWIGNFAVTGIWALRAFATRSGEVMKFAAREILFTDVLFTALFGSAVVMSGFALAGVEHLNALSTAWIRRALFIIAGAGVAWIAVLVPLEVRLYRSARSGAADTRAFVIWNVVGWAVTLALLFVIYLMIAKPV